MLERVEARTMLLQLGGWKRDAALLQLALGARFGEIAGLTPSDIDLRRGTVQIVRRVSTETVRANKNHRARTLELPGTARPTVERLIAQACDPEPLPDLRDREWPAGPWARRWLVQTATGRHANLSSLNKAIKAACRAADVPQLGSSHGLRHTYVSWMIDEGYTAEQVAFWIGDTPETVRKVYAHMLEASSRPAAEAVDRALGVCKDSETRASLLLPTQWTCGAPMTRLQEFENAAVEALWMCRLAESRLLTPTDPPALDRYQHVGEPGHPWKYDYYSHVLASQRLMYAAEAINEILSDGGLEAALLAFHDHWGHMKGLRNVLQHPKSTDIRWDYVWAYLDRISYQLPSRDPQWVLTIDELHRPVESLWLAAQAALEAQGGSRYEKDGRLRPHRDPEAST